jgi:phenylacetate-CoA ligase
MFNRIYTKLVAGCLFPLHELLKKHHTVRIKQQLEKTQWHSREQILEAQQLRLQKFIRDICRHVPYYQHLLQKLNLSASDIQTTADLAKLPFLDKTIIRNNFAELKHAHTGIVRPFTTGGSSGTPLTFLLGNERISHDVAEKWRATRWWGVDIGDKEIVAWGSPIELNKQDKIKIWRDRLFRSTLIPAFDLTETTLLKFIEQIRHEKPAMLFGYPSVFHVIAKTAQQHQLDLTRLGLKVVFVTSERLYPYQRELIEQVFNAPVANGYGGRDAGFIAHQCPHGNMHISAEDIIVEIIDKDGSCVPDGQSGEIVVTHLATRDFPFVRYRTGDIATKSAKLCPCGRGLPLLEQIEGRSTDFVIAADGTMMHGLALIYVIRELAGVSNFKIVQQSLLLTTVQLVVEKDVDATPLLATIEHGLQARLGENVQIQFELLDEIAAEASGKFRYVISKVAP